MQPATEPLDVLRSELVVEQTSSYFERHNVGDLDRMSTSSSKYSSVSSLVPSTCPTFSPSISTPSLALTSSLADNGERNKIGTRDPDIGLDLVCDWLRQKQMHKMWSIGKRGEGVMVQTSTNEYICSPPDLLQEFAGLHDAAKRLNLKCVITVNTRHSGLLLSLSTEPQIPLGNELRVQVLTDLSQLSTCQKKDFAAFIRHPPLLIVWDESPISIIDRMQDLEHQMSNRITKGYLGCQKRMSGTANSSEQECTVYSPSDLESYIPNQRRIVLIQACITAATLTIMCLALGAGWRNVAIELKVQGTWSCLLLPVLGPVQAWLGLFFFQALPTCVAQMIGPVRHMKRDSRSYTGRRPKRLSRSRLPHITIQCPVYKESLKTVIQPTILSVEAAISTYEMQGGTANIFINDDGLQLIPQYQAQERCRFYDDHGIGWVARPKHNAKVAHAEKAFHRAGKFKKASNMNYGLNVSVRVEEKLQRLQRSIDWTAWDECAAYDVALAEVICEDNGNTWAGGNIRVGDYILLIDSDTRIPSDCFLDAVSELEQSPEVAILQFSSGVMNVTESWFEKGITFFTHLIYTAIEFAVANGDVAPFVGHNAFLRWSAIQDVAMLDCELPTYRKFWSEDTVSEDFDIALRLQTSGYGLRLATYAKNGFKEGVSLTVYDELARWEKYAYGCGELVFHPFVHWVFKGPFTPLFRRFIFSSIPLHSKISIMAYVGTYFAIGTSWLLTVLNYFLIGWYNGYLNHYYVESFQIYFSTIVVFNCVGNVSLALLRYRIDEKKLLPSLLENFKWVIFLTIFLSGISLHVSQAILCHLFSINMSWGTTSKEATDTSFFQEVPIILRKFRFTFAFCLCMAAVMVMFAGIGPLCDVIPHDWQITKFTAIFPLGMMLASHAMLPLVLNPGLMQFTF